jgi:hypothetical protein
MVDKRKELTPARLEQLAKMRERLAEVQKEKKAKASEALSAQAKKTKKVVSKKKPDEEEALEDEDEADEIEESSESEVDDIKPIPKIKRKPKAGHVTTRSEGIPEFFKVKEMIDLAYPELSAQRKQAKWKQRKSEILSEVQQMLKPESKEDKPAPVKKDLVDISQLFS